MIRLHHPHLPSPRKLLPYRMRRFHSETASPVSTNNKELCHVPDILITRDLRASHHQNKTRQFAVNPDKERAPVRLFPIQRKILVPKTAISAELHVMELAEIVRVQLEKISQDWLLLRLSGNNFDMRRWFFFMPCHNHLATNLASSYIDERPRADFDCMYRIHHGGHGEHGVKKM